MTLRPARLEPIFSPRPWGARSLAPYFPDKTNLAEPLGEAWMTGSECTFADGPFAGKKLGEVWPTLPVSWTGTRVDHAHAFPLLVKFIFAEEKLSVQVHPDDAYAQKHEAAAGGRGKTEMWYAVSARPGAEVLTGLKAGITRESFVKMIADGTAEDALLHVPMSAGDAIFIPAGTMHTIGAGLVLCEIQQLSDITYRVYDYNRRDANGKSRELHIEKALDVTKFGAAFDGKITPVRIESPNVTTTYFAACSYFAAEKWEFSRPLSSMTSPEHFELIVILDGAGSISVGADALPYERAHVWLLPAALGAYEMKPTSPTSVLRTYVPDSVDGFTDQLKAAGISSADISRLVHA
ncbi:MAG: type I phosphomannose isomerase catalytic subunit [Candidatus Acidiferrales bacterium]|jgi:mannose-6-phosphate isomerase